MSGWGWNRVNVPEIRGQKAKKARLERCGPKNKELMCINVINPAWMVPTGDGREGGVGPAGKGNSFARCG